MKEKSSATLRRAASLRCRTDAAIERLGRNISYYERGYITAGGAPAGGVRRRGPGRKPGTQRS